MNRSNNAPDGWQPQPEISAVNQQQELRQGGAAELGARAAWDPEAAAELGESEIAKWVAKLTAEARTYPADADPKKGGDAEKSPAEQLREWEAAQKEYDRGCRWPRSTVRLGRYEPQASPEPPKPSPWDHAGEEKLATELVEYVRGEVLVALRQWGFDTAWANEVYCLLTQYTWQDRDEDPLTFHYEVLAERWTLAGVANRQWTEEGVRYLLFVRVAEAYVRGWRESLLCWRDELSWRGCNVERALQLLTKAREYLRYRRSWTAWDTVVDKFHRAFALERAE